MIRSSYYLELYKSEVPIDTPWIINHNLNSTEVIVTTLGLEIDSVKILDRNNVMINVSDFWWESDEDDDYQYTYEIYVLRIGTERDKKSIIDNISYMKVGHGKSKHWNALFEGDLADPYDNKYSISKYEHSNYYAIKGEIISAKELIEMNITEIGLFDENDRILFYTKCSLLHKPKNVDLTVWYRIIK